MNWSVKLAKSLIKDKTLQRHYFIQVICQIAIALCITTVLISSFLIRGFENKIEEKIFNFWSHIRISALSNSVNSITESPIQINLNKIDKTGLSKLIPVVNKGVILKHRENIEGIILKGIPLHTNTDFLFKNEKSIPYDTSSEIPLILSDNTLAKLNAEIGSILFINIIDSVPKTLKAKVINSYFTNIEEFDSQIALSDISIIQKINQWKSDNYSWVEVSVSDKKQILSIAQKLYDRLPEVNVETIYTIFPQLFDWLALMKKNELIILIVMLVVAIVNIISTISIFIIEKTKLIGILKVLGAKNKSIYQLMYFQVIRIIMIGIFYGNLLTFILAAIMYYLKPIKLDPSIYYINYAPVHIDLFAWFVINLLTIIVCFISAWIPLMTISKISPVKVAEYN